MAASLEVGGWRAELDALLARFGRLFARAEPRQQAGRYLEGLLGPVDGKNGWQLAEAIGDARPWGTQRGLSHVLWDEEAARDLCREHAVARLGAEDAVLVVDETGFPKKGRHSAGVARQYCGTLGKVENCQVGVFLAYGSRGGHALIDRRLYLPEAWAGDAERRRAAKVPEDVPFLTKPAIARAMLARALDAGVPCGWVLGDEVYGADRRLRTMLEERGKPYLLTVRGNDALEAGLDGGVGRHEAAALARALPPPAWRRWSAGAGTKGERLYDWAERGARIGWLVLRGAGWRRRAAPPLILDATVPFKLNQDRRHRIPRQRHKVANWREYDASLRQRGSLTVWFTDEAVAAWAAEPRTTRGGQPWYSALAILTAPTLRAVFRLAYRQAEGLIGSVIDLLGLALRVPDPPPLSRGAATREGPRRRWGGAVADSEPVHLLVDSTGLKLCGAGEWLLEKHGTKRRRAWRKMHLGVDANTGQIVASTLTTHDVDDGSQVGPLLDQVAGPVASFRGDGAYDQDGVYASVAERHPEAAIIVPPRATAVPSATAETAPTQRDRHLQLIAETGRMGWQKTSGYNARARAEATVGRFKRVVGDGLRSRTDERRATEMDVAGQVLNRMLELGRPESVRIA